MSANLTKHLASSFVFALKDKAENKDKMVSRQFLKMAREIYSLNWLHRLVNKFWKKTTRKNIKLINYVLRVLETAKPFQIARFFILSFSFYRTNLYLPPFYNINVLSSLQWLRWRILYKHMNYSCEYSRLLRTNVENGRPIEMTEIAIERSMSQLNIFTEVPLLSIN